MFNSHSINETLKQLVTIENNCKIRSITNDNILTDFSSSYYNPDDDLSVTEFETDGSKLGFRFENHIFSIELSSNKLFVYHLPETLSITINDYDQDFVNILCKVLVEQLYFGHFALFILEVTNTDLKTTVLNHLNDEFDN